MPQSTEVLVSLDRMRQHGEVVLDSRGLRIRREASAKVYVGLNGMRRATTRYRSSCRRWSG